jgi:D-arabinose 1-dehydrogenase-like Zn-dependent alcohol dehydrogenase
MKTIQVPKPGGPLELVEREIPTPQEGWVRVKVEACGICHSDALVKEGHWPGISYPRVPGHEIAGVVDLPGAGVTQWSTGQRVGIGWYGGHCGVCLPCRRGDFVFCVKGGITGFTHDGGYSEYMVAPAQSLAAIPDGIPSDEAAPLMCAGITTFNALRHAGAHPGDLVAVQAIGGLGHLAVQYAAKFGYRVAAISRGDKAKELAIQLGAHAYIDSAASDPAAELQKMGGASVILATAPSGPAMSALIGGLGLRGKLMVVGASVEPIEVSPIQLIQGSKTVQGWASGVASDIEDTLGFSAFAGVHPMIETFPLVDAAKAYERMTSGKARFRVVITM